MIGPREKDAALRASVASRRLETGWSEGSKTKFRPGRATVGAVAHHHVAWSERIRLRVRWQVRRRSGQPVAGDWSTPLAPEVVERSMCLLVCPEFTSLVRPVMGPHDSDTDSRDQRLFVRMVRMCLNWGEGQEYGQAKGLATGSF